MAIRIKFDKEMVRRIIKKYRLKKISYLSVIFIIFFSFGVGFAAFSQLNYYVGNEDGTSGAVFILNSASWFCGSESSGN